MKKQFFFILFLSFIFSCQNDKPQKLTIATAANMQFAMKALTQSFSEETGIECETIIGSSGKLTAQIQQGAPFDIFISADMKYPKALEENGMSLAPPQIYAYGNLVLWSLKLSKTRLDQFSSCITSEKKSSCSLLNSDTIRHIAIANPKTAPYGLAAIEFFKKYSLLERIENKLVYGESIAQTNQFITTQAAEIGITAKSVVLSPGLKERGVWISIPTDAHQPIAQGVLLLKNAKKNLPPAQKFNDFLFSPKAKEILNNFGYQVKDSGH